MNLSLPAGTSRGLSLLRSAGVAMLLCASAAGAQTVPSWTRGATCYEVFVRSFQDSDGDGIGDLQGLISRLDYINDGDPASHRSLGARCIWLMPVDESPSYHGYDVSDYYHVARAYGSNADFTALVAAAHRRGIRVLVDLVLNHSSSRHPYFQAALHDTTSPYRSWYRWSPTHPAERGPWGQDAWVKSPVRDEYYYAIFSPGMPDLNYGNPAVLAEGKKIEKFWLEEMHVDGFRLDAVSYLSEDHGRSQHSPGTHAALRELEQYARSVVPEVFTVGEVYAPIDTVLAYYPDQLDSYFAFEVADSIISGVAHGSATHMLEPALRLQREAPEGRWSPFLRNHDQPRTRTELGGDMDKAKVAALLLLTMPGMPFVYYGEEIGMSGAKPDPRLRTPMQWTAKPGAGFTRGVPWERLADDSAAVSVESEEHDPSSLLNLHRRLIHLRDSHPALASGTIVPLQTGNAAVAAYLRISGTHAALVVANLGIETLRDVTLTGAAHLLPAGSWHLTNLLGTEQARATTVGADGQLAGYVPLPLLAPKTGYLFDLAPVTAPARDSRAPERRSIRRRGS